MHENCGWLEIPTSNMQLAVRVVEALFHTRLHAETAQTASANGTVAHFTDADGRSVFLHLPQSQHAVTPAAGRHAAHLPE